MMGSDIALDLGTSSVKIYVSGKGIVLNEPAVAAVDTYTDEVLAMGEEAYTMVGRTSERVRVVHPLCNGVISEYDLAEYIIGRYMKKISSSRVFMPRVVVSVPCEITEVEKRAVVDAISASGVRKVCLIEEPVAAAMGAGMEITEPHGTLVVDIGGGTTDMAVISLGGIAVSDSIKVAGDAFDEDIIKYLRRKYNLIIGQRMAEEAKKKIGCVVKRPDPVFFRVKGRNAATGLPAFIDMTGDEMLEAMQEPVQHIVRALQNLLEQTPPELMGDVYTDGAVLTGGSAQIYGMDQILSREAKLPVRIAEEPQVCVAKGAGYATKYIGAMDGEALTGINPLSAAY